MRQGMDGVVLGAVVLDDAAPSAGTAQQQQIADERLPPTHPLGDVGRVFPTDSMPNLCASTPACTR